LEEPSTTRARPPQKARLSDGATQLFPHAVRRHDGGRAVLRAETAVAVCRDTGVSRNPPGSPQSAATSIGIGSKGVGWPTRGSRPTLKDDGMIINDKGHGVGLGHACGFPSAVGKVK